MSNIKPWYKFSIRPNLNKLLADRRANIKEDKIMEKVREEIKKVFDAGGGGVDRVYFSEKSKEFTR
jgi:hypothetical protein